MRRKDFDRDKFILETWPEALESGEYKQAKERLYDQTEKGYCCLGVACKLLNDIRLLKKAEWINEQELPSKACCSVSAPAAITSARANLLPTTTTAASHSSRSPN